jgi:hypothetical protein
MSWDALDAVIDAVEEDERTLGVSVAGEKNGASVFLSVDAGSPNEAKEVSEAIVHGALARRGLQTGASAMLVFDEEGNVAP